MYKKLTDAALLDLLKKSDYTAYTEIYNRYYYLMISHAYKKLRDEEQAKDVVQELFTMVWQRRDKDIKAINLGGYLYTSLRNRIIDIFIHSTGKSVSISLTEAADVMGPDDTDHRIRERQFRDYIEKEIQALPRKMRAIFELSIKDRYTTKEIAQKLDTSEHNVSKQLGNARRILKSKLNLWIFILLAISVLKAFYKIW
ncbi:MULTISPECIES: RNA polymerase sigma factor [Pedobacter]|uniref:RNA polymerase sigma factor n=1 Tax=Pedobacter TaxID=84567 RepID=UPI00210A71BD|nr:MULTISPECIES: sigma-70 family RNA polymerase sigma factor [unclassified Pedobacter]